MYYLLIVLLILGGFAAMAQNDYGVKILGTVAGAFGLLFFLQLIRSLQNRDNKIEWYELGSLVLLSMILAMRVYYIRFDFIEVVFGLSGGILIGVYIVKLYQSLQILLVKSKRLALIIVLFHSSIIFYTFSMVSVPFFPVLSEPSGAVAFAILITFIILNSTKIDFLLDGEKVTGFTYVLKFKDRSIVLLTLFVLFTAYMGLTKIGILPRMYSDEFPQAYFELVKQAESGIEKPVNGKYKHEEFKEMYDQFVSRNNVADQK